MSVSEAVMFLVIFAGLVLCLAYFRASLRASKTRKGDGDAVARESNG